MEMFACLFIIGLSFLFHLEDWFEQLKEHKVKLGSDLNLNSEFVF